MNEIIELVKQAGINLAKAEKDYKIAFTKNYYELKEKKEPATTILKIIYGIEEVASLREKRDIAEIEYKIAQEKLYALKSQKFISAKKQNEEEKIAYYSKVADEKFAKDNTDILDNFDDFDFNYQIDDNREKIPQIIEDFYQYSEKNKK